MIKYILLSLILTSCVDQKLSRMVHEKEIMKMHEAQREYHFQKMSEEFAGQLTDDFISVNRGELSQQSFEEHKARYDRYFASVEFEKWDDTEKPIIRFSDDHSLAYTIVQKDVIVRYPDDNGTILRDRVHFAWLAVYRIQKDGNWKIESVASTNSEPVVNKLD